MRLRMSALIVLLVALATLACSLASGTSAVTPATSTKAPTATIPPIAPTHRAVTPTASNIIALPTLTVMASGTLTTTATPTMTVTATAAPTVPPRSTGPLDFQVRLAGCRLDSGRQGGVVLTFQVDATGGNGLYTYIREGQIVPKISERLATKGTAVIDAWRVRSDDGQEVERKFRFTGKEFGCP